MAGLVFPGSMFSYSWLSECVWYHHQRADCGWETQHLSRWYLWIFCLPLDQRRRSNDDNVSKHKCFCLCGSALYIIELRRLICPHQKWESVHGHSTAFWDRLRGVHADLWIRQCQQVQHDCVSKCSNEWVTTSHISSSFFYITQTNSLWWW